MGKLRPTFVNQIDGKMTKYKDFKGIEDVTLDLLPFLVCCQHLNPPLKQDLSMSALLAF